MEHLTQGDANSFDLNPLTTTTIPKDTKATTEQKQNSDSIIGSSSPSAPILIRRRTTVISAVREEGDDGSRRRGKRAMSLRRLFRSLSTMMIPERRIDEEPTVRESVWAIVRCSCMFLFVVL